MKLKRFEIVDLFELVEELSLNDFNKFFSYHLAKIKKELSDEFKLIIETSKPKEEYLNYVNKRKEILNKYCEKVEGQKDRLIPKEGFADIVKQELEALFVVFEEAIKERKKEEFEFVNFLNGEVEVSLEKIPFDCLPDKLSKQKMEILLPLL